MDKKATFLQAFRDLEKFLRIEYVNGNYKESTFMGTLYRIKGRKENLIIANPHYFDCLQQASQLRNIIVHNTDVAEPTDRFLKQFIHIVDKILHPVKVVELMVPLEKIKKVRPDESIGDVIDLMDITGYSKIPIFASTELVGVFTEKSLYYYLWLHKQGNVSRDMKIQDLMDAIDLDGNPARYFSFIAKTANAFQALQYFRRDFREKNKLEMLFVTPTGKKDEPILGILTLADIERAI
jgi:Mg2+/Co2+ transporter CorB